MKTIKDIDFSGQRVFVRVDFNVPLDKNQNITDDTRIRAVLPTLRHILDNGGKLIVGSHLGRPKGKPVPEFSLSPAAKRLGELLEKNVAMASDCIGPDVAKQISEMKPGDAYLLENLRYHAEEQENDDTFAKALADNCDVYVNDAFAVSHRMNASVGAIAKHVPVCAAGFLLQKEIDYFEKAMANPRRPLAAIIGGAKVSSKLKALNNMLQKVDKLIIGGAMANTFLKGMGHDVGKSKVEDDLVETAGQIAKTATERGIKFYLPVDAVAADRLDAAAVAKKIPVHEIPKDWMVLDIGPASALLFSEALYDVQTIIWNGPMGVFETDAFSGGTMSMARAVANSHALSIVGGGDTNAAVHMAGEADRISYISTGGGAFLKLMEGKSLPGVEILG